jgi:hypothetical protein
MSGDLVVAHVTTRPAAHQRSMRPRREDRSRNT